MGADFRFRRQPRINLSSGGKRVVFRAVLMNLGYSTSLTNGSRSFIVLTIFLIEP